MNHEVIVGLFEIARKHLWKVNVSSQNAVSGRASEHTITTDVQIDNATYSDIDDTKKALVLLLELLLVEYLYGKYAVVGCSSAQVLVAKDHCAPRDMETYKSKASFQYGFSVFFMTWVVWVCSPLMVATAKGSGNPRMSQ